MGTRLLEELRSGSAVTCAFLTDGSAGRARSPMRDEESRAALTSLGVAAEEIHFIGSAAGIPDGSLVDHLDRALQALEERLGDRAVTDVFCLAWEGGHQDHDASQIVAAAFAARRGARCLEMPLYHAGGILRGRLFRVLSPLEPASWSRRLIALRDGWRVVRLTRFYRSQRRSWTGLLPEAFLNLVVLRRERSRPVDPARYRFVPHPPPLLYELRFGMSWDRFRAAARPFVERHFG